MGCGKTAYSKTDARQALDRIQERSKRGKGNHRKLENRSYWCDDCQGYHLSSHPDTSKKRR